VSIDSDQRNPLTVAIEFERQMEANRRAFATSHLVYNIYREGERLEQVRPGSRVRVWDPMPTVLSARPK
jgi:hypothetical protein